MDEVVKVAGLTNGMHVYGWPISSKVAKTEWNHRRHRNGTMLGRQSHGPDWQPKDHMFRQGKSERRKSDEECSFTEAVRGGRWDKLSEKVIQPVKVATMRWDLSCNDGS